MPSPVQRLFRLQRRCRRHLWLFPSSECHARLIRHFKCRRPRGQTRLVVFDRMLVVAWAASDQVDDSRRGRQARGLFLALPDGSGSSLDLYKRPSLERWPSRLIYVCFSDSAVMHSEREARQSLTGSLRRVLVGKCDERCPALPRRHASSQFSGVLQELGEWH